MFGPFSQQGNVFLDYTCSVTTRTPSTRGYRFFSTSGFALIISLLIIILATMVGQQIKIDLFPFSVGVGILLGITLGITQGLISLGVCLAALAGYLLWPELLPSSSQDTVLLRIGLSAAGTLLAGGIIVVSGRVSKRSELLLNHARIQGNIDGVTGISNRRHANELLHQEVERSRRRGYSLSILLVDIDNFKGINDSFGHPVGDAVLKEFVGVIQGQLRTYDVLARWGGDEFLVLLPDTTNDQGRRIAERLRGAVERHSFVQSAVVTISIGVGSLEGADDVAALLGRADEFLFSAKRQGRNKTQW